MSCGRKIGPFDCCSVVFGDCTQLMQQIPDESIDLIWTDPPYGNSNHEGDWNASLNEHRGIESKPILNDNPKAMKRVVDAMLDEAARVLKKASCCCCCCCGGGGPRPVFAWLADRMDRDGLQFFHSVIWDKKNPGLGWVYRRQHEMIMIAHRAGGKLLWDESVGPTGNILTFSPPRERDHPNEKPIDLVLEQIKRHSFVGSVVLDPFAGSGTTLVAAHKLERHYLGFELSKVHYDMTMLKLNTVRAQPSLFAELDVPETDRDPQDKLFETEVERT